MKQGMWAVVALGLLAIAMNSPPALAADESPAQDAAPSQPASENKDAAPPAKDPQAEWQTSTQRKLEIARRLQQVQTEFAAADAAGKESLREEYQDLLFEYRNVLLPRLQHLAPQIYEQNPQDAEAAVLVLTQAYEENNYQRALEIAQQLQQAQSQYRGIKKTAVNLVGACQFALHQFAEAHETLAAAQKAGLLDPQFGGETLLEQSKKYVELWKQEQAIREREAAAEGNERLPRVRLKTSKGDVVLELFENQAPNTVANFISLVEAKKYDGTKFHRVIPNFMAQGGDLTTREGGTEPGYTIDCECDRDDARKHFRGSLSMAHAGKNTGDSQFFLTVMPTYWLNDEPRPETVHTVFGRVVEGIEVVDQLRRDDQIESAEVIFKRNHDYQPKTNPLGN